MDIVDRDKSEDDEGALAAQLENLKRGIPNLIALKERIDGGDTLSDIEIANLEDVFKRARSMIHVYDENPEVQDVVARVISIYEHIASGAVANEKTGGMPSGRDSGKPAE